MNIEDKVSQVVRAVRKENPDSHINSITVLCREGHRLVGKSIKPELLMDLTITFNDGSINERLKRE
jgi:hypothetical protein